ncbi:MAG TPA: Nif3-like dinuclear metal center hexameric protein [Candidatus Acidoferrum sp.]|nr:Nif3-like dinuclear metal center hexameric protein [Candidatus Acidoferrum sp.]
MTTIHDILMAFEEVAPLRLAEDFDNPGLLAGDHERSVERVLVALDVTDAVIDEAIAHQCGLIVSHHPVFFKLGNTVNPGPTPEGKLFKLIENKIAALCLHTNMDIAIGGVNDMLVAKLGLAPAGAFSVTNEEFGSCIGRIGKLKTEMPAADFAAHVRDKLDCDAVKLLDTGRPVSVVGVVGGAGGGMAREALAAGCDTYVTAEVKHHQYLEAMELGVNLIDAGHYHTERFIADRFVRLLSKFEGLEVLRSATLDRDIVRVV